MRRKSFRKGKEIKTLGKGEYEITLFIENTGTLILEGLTVIDGVPTNFKHGMYTIEPGVESLKDKDSLYWNLPNLFPSDNWKTTYRIWGIGDYTSKDAQFVL